MGQDSQASGSPDGSGRTVPVERSSVPLLVETRFQPPRPSPQDVWRPAVARLLDQATTHRVTIVAAPTGYGKTTAIASWMRSRPEPIGWLSLESADDREARFASYLTTAVRRAVPGVGATALAALQDPEVDIEADVIGSLVNDLATQDTEALLVLDDLQAITSRGCQALLATFVAAMPRQLRLIISTRVDPALPLGRLRARGELGEIRVEDLRFTHAEVRTFFDQRLAMPLGPGSVDALIERTEGWPAVLNLVALSLASESRPDDFVRTFAGSNRQVVDYLVSEDPGSPAGRPAPLPAAHVRAQAPDRRTVRCGDGQDGRCGPPGRPEPVALVRDVVRRGHGFLSVSPPLPRGDAGGARRRGAAMEPPACWLPQPAGKVPMGAWTRRCTTPSPRATTNSPAHSSPSDT